MKNLTTLCMFFYGLISLFPDAREVGLRSKYPCAPLTLKLLNDLAEVGIHAAQWTTQRWDREYYKSTSSLDAFILRTSTSLVGMGLPCMHK